MRCNAKWFLLVLLAIGASDHATEVIAPRPVLAALPIAFEANEGQTDASVRYLARGPGYGLFLTEDEAVLSAGGDAVRMKLVNANPSPRITGDERLPGKVNYFKGNDPEKWRTNISTYRKVRYHEVYPGIDLVYYGKAGQLEYDFVVKPGADPDAIAFELDEEFELDPSGDLVLATETGEFRQKRPVVYQGEQRIDGEFVMLDDGAMGFEVGTYDRLRPLVIDPVLHFSTYLGGTGGDMAGSVAVDASGSAYVFGITTSVSFPGTSSEVLQDTLSGGDYDCFVSKINAAGTALVYSTYLGGNDRDDSSEIAVDSSGCAYLVGLTSSADFPGTASSPIQSQFRGGSPYSWDGYIAKLAPDGDSLVYAAYLGGTGFDVAVSVAVDGSGSAVIVGYGNSADFPTVNPYQATYGGGDTDIYVAKVDPAGAQLVYSTYLGGSQQEFAWELHLADSDGRVFIAGETNSADFPLVSPIQGPPVGGGGDTIVVVLNETGTALEFSTLLGGGQRDWGSGIVATGGAIYVAGCTYSTDFPVEDALFPQHHGGVLGPSGADCFVARIEPHGEGLVWSTFLGGSGDDFIWELQGDAAGSIHLTGYTNSPDLPLVDPIQLDHHLSDPPTGSIWDESDAFVVALRPEGDGIVHSTYLGGSGLDGAHLAVNDAGQTWIVGYTGSLDFPTLHAIQPGHAGGNFDALPHLGPIVDGFITRIGPEDTDGDGLLDEWELHGYTHENGEFVDLPTWGANPTRKDVFVEIDYMAGFEPTPEALAAVEAAFAAAPVDNPDGTTGITLRILSVEEIPHVSSLGTLDGGDYVWTRPDGSAVTHFDDLKALHFPKEMEWSVHYCIWADTIPGDYSGMSRGVEASDFIVSLGPFIEDAGGTVDPRWESGTFMHELGHNLGLKHGGNDELRHKPNYLSVMNPSFQLEGLYFDGARGHWDYSFDTLPDLAESALDERIGLQGTTAVNDFGTTWWMDGLPSVIAQQWTTAVNEPINWWDETVLGQDPVFEVRSLNINDSPNGEIEDLTGFNDWPNLVFTGGEVGGGVQLPLPPRTPADEQTLAEVQSFSIPEQVTGLKGHDPNKMYTLTWNPIKPKTEMTEYRVYRDGDQIAATTNTNYKDQAITPGDTHVYWITWVNLLGQESVPGNKVTIGG